MILLEKNFWNIFGFIFTSFLGLNGQRRIFLFSVKQRSGLLSWSNHHHDLIIINNSNLSIYKAIVKVFFFQKHRSICSNTICSSFDCCFSTYFRDTEVLLFVERKITGFYGKSTGNSSNMSMNSKRRSASCEFLSRHHNRMAEVYATQRIPRSNSARKKSVQWRSDLEEVRYYIPHRSKSESIKRKIRKVRRKAERLSDLSFSKVISNFGEPRAAGFRLGLKCIGGQSLSMDHTDFERFEDYNKQWDYLFELYGSTDHTDPWTMNRRVRVRRGKFTLKHFSLLQHIQC